MPIESALAFLFPVLVAILYWPSRNGVFLFDDQYILHNYRVQHYHPEMRSRIPSYEPNRQYHLLHFHWRWLLTPRILTWVTYWRDMAVHSQMRTAGEIAANKPAIGEKVNRVGFHATNMALHGIASALVYAMLLRFVDWPQAFAGASVFAVHPLCTAAVCPLAGRSSLLCGTLYLATLVAALAGYWLLVPVLAIAAFKAKEEAVALPFALIGLLWIVNHA